MTNLSVKIIGLGLLVVLFWLALKPAFVVLALLPQIQAQPLDYVTREPDVSTTEIEFKSFTIPVDIYTPAGKVKKVLVVLPAANETGKDSERVRRVGRVFSKAGFEVYAATLPSINREVLLPQVTEEMEKVVLEAANRRPDVPITLFSFSVGVGAELIVAAEENVRDQLNLIVTLGGYYDLRNVYEFHQRDERADPFGQVVLNNYLTNISEDETDEYFQALNPEQHLSEIQAPVLIIHSRPDRIIPFSESEKLFAKLNELNKPAYFIKLNVLDHVNPEFPPLTFRNFFATYLLEFWQMYKAAVIVLYF